MEGIITLDRVGTEALQGPPVSEPIIPESEEVRRYATQQTTLHDRLLLRAIELADLPTEQQLLEKTARLVGGVCVAEACNGEAPPLTLMEAVQRAEAGDIEARKLVKSNVLTDYIERAYKSGHVIRVVLTANQANKLMQHGQTMEEVATNSLRHINHPALIKRGRIEAHNGTRQQFCYETGLLKDNAILTRSTVLDDISREEAKKLGYFTETMSCADQLLTVEEGEIVLYSAFVAGADSPDDERFDLDAIVASSAEFGIDYSGLSSNEILARPALIPKRLLPNGILTVVEKYDKHAPGDNRFFGRIHNGPQDYKQHMVECRRREEEAEVRVEKVVSQLLAASKDFRVPTDATKLLDELNDLQLKVAITSDTSIDANVLGAKARQYVEAARHHIAHGNKEALLYAQHMIVATGASNSCPTGGSTASGVEDVDSLNQEDNLSSKLEDCDFISKECPKCGEKNVFTKCRNGKYYGSCGCVG